jgi:hypothetical protein
MDQQGAEFSEDLGRDSSCFLREALKEYREAYRLASEAPVQSPAAFSLIFAAAGQRIIGILDDRYPASDHSSDALAAKAEMLSIEEHLKTGGRPRHVENAVISSR